MKKLERHMICSYLVTGLVTLCMCQSRDLFLKNWGWQVVWVGEASLLWGEVELDFLLLRFGRRDSGEFYPDIRSCFEKLGKTPLYQI